MKHLLISCITLLVPVGYLLAQTGPVTGNQINIASNIDTSVEGVPLNYLVNTAYKEYGPMPTKDGKRLYFSRQGHPQNTGGENDEDIWYSEFDEVTQTWTEAKNIGPPLNTAGPNFVAGVGVNSDTLLLGNIYGKKGKMTSGISVSVRVGDLWSFPQPINISGDYNISGKASYDLSHDRNALIIAQEKIDSYGKLDLYVALRDPDAKYPYSGKESFNLGPVINSFGNETSPWLSYDGRTLYFSSDGHNGYGNLDIFMAKRLDDTWTNWSKPVNLGSGINSMYDDMSFNFNPNDRYAYYSRGLSPSNVDIYRVEMTHLFKGVKSAGKELKVADLEIGQVETVNNVFTEDGIEISDQSVGDLQYIIDYLKKNKELIVLISAHANVHESRNESFRISNERASVIMSYLVNKGIEKNRLSYRGLGHDIVINTSSAEIRNKLTGSVEFKLIDFSQ